MEQTHEIPGACHKWFRTMEQAKAFIEDWKDSFADVWRREVRRALDIGLRPQDMNLSVPGILRGDRAVEEITDEIKDKLKIDQVNGSSTEKKS